MEREELIYLERVRDLIGREIASMETAQQNHRREIREQNRAFLEEHPYAAVYGRAEALRRENESRCMTIEELELKKRTLAAMLEAPYFGRVDFVFDGESEPERLYIGVASVTDPDTGEILVYDWRAPVSALFYYGETGRASYAAPAGEIAGEITRIRQYRFENGALAALWDADLQIDDAVLRDALSGPAAGQMKSIVCTIQREQNRAIRSDPRKNLAVFGPAGCGKTSVGMHRLSWILYRLRADGYRPTAMLFTANDAFRSYVSGVLPELGELNAKNVGFRDLFRKYLPGFSVLPQLEQTDALLTGNAARAKRLGMLYDPGFLAFLETSLRETQLRFQEIRLYEDTILSPDALMGRFAALPDRTPVRERLRTVADWAQEEISNFFLIRKKEIMKRILDEMELGDSSEGIYRKMRFSVLTGARNMILGASESDPVLLTAALLERYYGANAPAFRADAEQHALLYEEAAVSLYTAVLLGAGAGERQADHILIDEAQDLAPVQHKILRALYRKTVFTVLADGNQGIAPAVNTDEDTIEALYGAGTIRINKSYRATRQLCEFSKRFLPPERAQYEAFRRDGPPPFAYETDDPAAKAAELLLALQERGRSACVILKTAAGAADFGKTLKRTVPACRVITEETKALEGKLFCMPAALTKGLEFDAVILPEADGLDKNPALSYLTTTRALHELHLIRRTSAG